MTNNLISLSKIHNIISSPIQIQCILQDVGSHIATPRDRATEKKLGESSLNFPYRFNVFIYPLVSCYHFIT